MIDIMTTGFLMALADSVPGVSGGTVVFILGYYDRFITALSDLIYETGKPRVQALSFLAKIAFGWVLGMVIAVLILAQMFTTHIYSVSSLFLGFVAASIPMIIREERDALRSRPRDALFALPGALVVVAISSASLSAVSHGLTFTIGTSLYALAAGALAVSAMVLPGISGSSLLMALGLYIPVITGIKSLLGMDLSRLWLLTALGVGVLLGILFILRGIKLLLDRYRSAMIYAILGMMAGSLYAIAKGPETLTDPLPMMTISTFRPLFFLIGCILPALLFFIKSVMTKNTGSSAGR